MTNHLQAVPEPGGPSATTLPRAGSTNHQDDSTKERHEMSTDNTNLTSTDLMNDMEALTMTDLQPRGVLGIYNDLTCAALGLVLDVIVVVVVARYWDNGVIPGWLDTHGHWAWLAAGVVVAVFLSELVGAVTGLDYEAGRLGQHRRTVRALAGGGQR